MGGTLTAPDESAVKGVDEADAEVPEASGPAFESARPQLQRLADLFSVHLATVRA
jgi:hypothetical protein